MTILVNMESANYDAEHFKKDMEVVKEHLGEEALGCGWIDTSAVFWEHIGRYPPSYEDVLFTRRGVTHRHLPEEPDKYKKDIASIIPIFIGPLSFIIKGMKDWQWIPEDWEV